MKITHLVAGIAVAAGLIYAGVKGYAHYQIKSSIDATLALARPLADIRYQGLSTDLSGTATLTGISISPNEFPEIFMIDALTLRGPDLDFLINGFKASAQRGELPAQVELDLRGLHLSTEGHLLRSLDESLEQVTSLMQIEADGCGIGNSFDRDIFTALGYSEILMNLRMGYKFSATGIEINLAGSVGNESMTFTSHLTDVSRNLGAAPGTLPKLRDVKLRYRLDPQLTRKVVEYCAEKRGVDIDTYLTQIMQEPDELYMLHLGFVPGPGLRDALQSLLRNPGEMVIEARPYEPLDIRQLVLYSAEQIPDLLALTVTVNGRPVDDLRVSSLDLSERIDPVALTALQEDGVWTQQFGIQPRLPERTPSQDPATPATSGQFGVIDHSKLGDYVGRPVRILASGDRKRAGRLMKLDRGIATVEERIHGGTVTTSVALRDIKQVEVQF